MLVCQEKIFFVRVAADYWASNTYCILGDIMELLGEYQLFYHMIAKALVKTSDIYAWTSGYVLYLILAIHKYNERYIAWMCEALYRIH